jgi:hypothetical protein
MGLAWHQVSPTEPCDVAYVQAPADSPLARLCIQANPTAWADRAKPLQRIAQMNDLLYPVYQDDHAKPTLYRTADRVICERDLVFDLFWLVTGQIEQFLPQGKHGFWVLTEEAPARAILRQALGSRLIRWLERQLRELGGYPAVPPWQANYGAAACVSHDVDYPQIIRWLEPFRILARRNGQGLPLALEVLRGKRTHWNFRAWVAMEQRLQVRSAFYFVPRQGSLWERATGTPDPFYDIASPPFRDLFRFLQAEGFEIGMHASYRAFTSLAKLVAEKQYLEAVSGVTVVGNRHHYWHLNPHDVEETLWFHEQAGFCYDASLFHDRYVGWRRGLAQPFFPFHQRQRRELKTLQIPTAWMDDQLFGQKEANPGDRWEIVRQLADTVLEHQGCLVIDVHDYVFDDQLFPGWRQTYQALWEYLAQQRKVWFATPAQVAQHWRERYVWLIKASEGLTLGLS